MNKKIHANLSPQLPGSVNLKYSLGGLVDIDNIIQFLLLKRPENFENCVKMNNFERLQFLSENSTGIEGLSEISNCYRLFKSLQIAIQNIFNVIGTD